MSFKWGEIEYKIISPLLELSIPVEQIKLVREPLATVWRYEYKEDDLHDIITAFP